LIDVAIIERNPIFREGLMRVLAQAGFKALMTYETLRHFAAEDLGGCEKLLVVADLEAVDGTIEDAVAAIRARIVSVQIVFISDCVSEAVLKAAIQHGADGLLRKQISCPALVKSLELILLGERLFPVLPFDLTAPVIRDPVSDFLNSKCTEALKRLSSREIEVLDCLSVGSPNKVIARKFGIAEATVKVHVKAILRKISAKNRTEAAMWAKNHGVDAASAHRPTDHVTDRRCPSRGQRRHCISGARNDRAS